MTHLPQPNAGYRSPRLRLADLTHAVLRLPDGRRTQGKLETISLTGGLLDLPKPLDRGARIKVMFLTRKGPVLGSAEMLSPISETRQPFRFVGLEDGPQRRLRSAVQSSYQSVAEEAWIEKYRAALLHRKPDRRAGFRVLLGALTLLTLCAGSAVYVFHLHLLK
jgi:hypothetical protein